MSNLTPPQTSILIRPYPFNTPLSATLITALDDELTHMYTNWDELPHPGFQHGKVGGDSLASDESHNPEPNLSSSTSADAVEKSTQVWDDRELPVVDADDGVEPGVSTHSGDVNDDRPVPDSMKGLSMKEIKTLHFHIAFDVSGLSPPELEDVSVSTSTLAGRCPAIACIGLKLMPYFPYHRQQPEGPVYSSTRHAEFKRVYIAPAYRGARVQGGQRLVEALLAEATAYARDVLKVEVLVLETGMRQAAAIQAYERSGWQRREVFGDYVGAGVEVGGVSMCYQFDLR